MYEQLEIINMNKTVTPGMELSLDKGSTLVLLFSNHSSKKYIYCKHIIRSETPGITKNMNLCLCPFFCQKLVKFLSESQC